MDNLETELEALIDRHGLTHIVNTIAVICAEKSDHVLESYQDKITAKAWASDAKTLTQAARLICSDG